MSRKRTGQDERSERAFKNKIKKKTLEREIFSGRGFRDGVRDESHLECIL